jgi:hypothetical protein
MSHAFVVEHRYRVAVGDLPALREAMAEVRAHAAELGLAGFELWLDDDERGDVREVHAYDSWSHWRRLAEKAPPPWMAPVYQRLGELIEGGYDAVETTTWRRVALEG